MTITHIDNEIVAFTAEDASLLSNGYSSEPYLTSQSVIAGGWWKLSGFENLPTSNHELPQIRKYCFNFQEGHNSDDSAIDHEQRVDYGRGV